MKGGLEDDLKLVFFGHESSGICPQFAVHAVNASMVFRCPFCGASAVMRR